MALTHRGHTKPSNQDRLLVREFTPSLHFFATIDGLGGQPGGEEAADTALACFKAYTASSSSHDPQLSHLLQRANDAIIARGDREPELYNMGATATLLLIHRNQAYWTHIGDCRLYHLHDRKLRQITRDHNLAQELFEEGKITKEEQRSHKFNHFLSQCLGEDDIEPDQGSFALAPGDLLLMCSDGVHDLLKKQTISAILTQEGSLEQRGNTLVQAALAAGGLDNISLILVSTEP